MVKYKVGDKVEVIETGLVGKIIDVDEEWRYPYEIDTDGENLYADDDLRRIWDEEPMLVHPQKEEVKVVVSKDDMITYPAYPTKSIDWKDLNPTVDIIDLLDRLEKALFEQVGTSFESQMALSKVKESRLWLLEHYRKSAD